MRCMRGDLIEKFKIPKIQCRGFVNYGQSMFKVSRSGFWGEVSFYGVNFSDQW